MGIAGRTGGPALAIAGRTGMTLDDVLTGHRHGQHDRIMSRCADLDPSLYLQAAATGESALTVIDRTLPLSVGALRCSSTVMSMEPCKQPRGSHGVRTHHTFWGAGIAQWLERGLVIERSRVRNPAVAAGQFFSPGSTFCADSYFGIRSTPQLPE